MAPNMDDLLALDMEYRLTIATRVTDDCDCIRYFIQRREVLLPEVMKYAEKTAGDPVDIFARYARGVHQRHLDGLSLAVA